MLYVCMIGSVRKGLILFICVLKFFLIVIVVFLIGSDSYVKVFFK